LLGAFTSVIKAKKFMARPHYFLTLFSLSLVAFMLAFAVYLSARSGVCTGWEPGPQVWRDTDAGRVPTQGWVCVEYGGQKW
jgi:hypothetical protein